MLLETGALGNEVRLANVAYGFGKGAEEPFTREQAMTLEVFSKLQLTDYMTT